jgi:hypothetical protein
MVGSCQMVCWRSSIAGLRNRDAYFYVSEEAMAFNTATALCLGHATLNVGEAPS